MFKSTLRIAILLPMICGICVSATAQKQLTKFVNEYTEEEGGQTETDTYELGYDAQNRLNSFKATDRYGDSNSWNVNITYSDGKAVIDGMISLDTDFPQTFVLNDKGLAVSYHRDGHSSVYDMTFEYDANGYLSKMTQRMSSPEGQEMGSLDHTFTWDKGNLTKFDSREITYGNNLNKGNLPNRFMLNEYPILAAALYAGLLGNTSKYLPTKIDWSTISYEFDAAGYTTTEQISGGERYSDKYTYTFTGNGGVAETTNSDVKVYANGNSIEVRGNKPGDNVEVFASNGQLFYKGNATSIAVASKGLYIVRTAGQAFKVAL